jgi:hypothetical protein
MEKVCEKTGTRQHGRGKGFPAFSGKTEANSEASSTESASPVLSVYRRTRLE